MRFFTALVLSIVGFCLGFFWIWIFRNTGVDIAQSATVTYGFVTSPGYRFLVMSSLFCKIVCILSDEQRLGQGANVR